jgi:hypothetical protein
VSELRKLAQEWFSADEQERETCRAETNARELHEAAMAREREALHGLRSYVKEHYSGGIGVTLGDNVVVARPSASGGCEVYKVPIDSEWDLQNRYHDQAGLMAGAAEIAQDEQVPVIAAEQTSLQKACENSALRDVAEVDNTKAPWQLGDLVKIKDLQPGDTFRYRECAGDGIFMQTVHTKIPGAERCTNVVSMKCATLQWWDPSMEVPFYGTGRELYERLVSSDG